MSQMSQMSRLHSLEDRNGVLDMQELHVLLEDRRAVVETVAVNGGPLVSHWACRQDKAKGEVEDKTERVRESIGE